VTAEHDVVAAAGAAAITLRRSRIATPMPSGARNFETEPLRFES
jgi:hypothetical protein